MSDLVAVADVVPHVFYEAFAYDEVVRGTIDPAQAREIRRADFGEPHRLADLELHMSGLELQPWLYTPHARRIFAREAKDVIESYLESADRVRFHDVTAVLTDGSRRDAFVALPTEQVDVLSARSEISPHGVAKRWALELSKLRDRTFFAVPHSQRTTAMRGDLILTLHALGWPGYVSPLVVVDGAQVVSLDDWAKHPEWTGFRAA